MALLYQSDTGSLAQRADSINGNGSSTDLDQTDISEPPFSMAVNGRMSPVISRTMKEVDQQIAELQKQNFSLKLRIFFLEERMEKQCAGSHEEIYKLNIELNVEVQSLKKELADKQLLLQKALTALESLTANHQPSRQSVDIFREGDSELFSPEVGGGGYAKDGEVAELKRKLLLKEKEFESVEARLVDTSRNLLEQTQRSAYLEEICRKLEADQQELGLHQLTTASGDRLTDRRGDDLEENIAIAEDLPEDDQTEKDSVIAELRCALNAKDVIIAQVEEEKMEVMNQAAEEAKEALKRAAEEKREAIRQVNDEMREALRQAAEEKQEALRLATEEQQMKLNALRQELIDTTHGSSDLELERMKQDLTLKLAECSDLHQALTVKDHTITELQTTLGNTQAQQKLLQSEVEKWSANVQLLNDELNKRHSINEELQQTQADLDKSRSDLNKTRTDFDKTRAELDKIKTDLELAKRDMEEKELMVKEERDKQVNLEQRLKDKEAEIKALALSARNERDSRELADKTTQCDDDRGAMRQSNGARQDESQTGGHPLGSFSEKGGVVVGDDTGTEGGVEGGERDTELWESLPLKENYIRQLKDDLKRVQLEYNTAIQEKVELSSKFSSLSDELNRVRDERMRSEELLDHYQQKLDELERQIEMMSNENAALKCNIAGLSEKLTQTEVDLKQTALDLHNTNRDLQQKRKELRQVKDDVEQKSKDLQYYTSRELDLATNVRPQIKALEEAKHNLEEKRGELHIVQRDLENKLEEIRHSRTEDEKDIKKPSQIIHEHDIKASAVLRQKINEIGQSKFNDKQKIKEQKTGELQQVKHELQMVQLHLENKVQELEKARFDLEQKTHELTQAKHETGQIRRELVEARFDLEQKSGELVKTNLDIEKKTAQLEQIKLDLENKVQELEKARFELEQKTHELTQAKHETGQIRRELVDARFDLEQKSGELVKTNLDIEKKTAQLEQIKLDLEKHIANAQHSLHANHLEEKTLENEAAKFDFEQKNELRLTKFDLDYKAQELTRTKVELEFNAKKLAQTQYDLDQKTKEFLETKNDLALMVGELTQARHDLELRTGELAQVKRDLELNAKRDFDRNAQKLGRVKNDLELKVKELEHTKHELDHRTKQFKGATTDLERVNKVLVQTLGELDQARLELNMSHVLIDELKVNRGDQLQGTGTKETPSEKPVSVLPCAFSSLWATDATGSNVPRSAKTSPGKGGDVAGKADHSNFTGDQEMQPGQRNKVKNGDEKTKSWLPDTVKRSDRFEASGSSGEMKRDALSLPVSPRVASAVEEVQVHDWLITEGVETLKEGDKCSRAMECIAVQDSGRAGATAAENNAKTSLKAQQWVQGSSISPILTEENYSSLGNDRWSAAGMNRTDMEQPEGVDVGWEGQLGSEKQFVRERHLGRGVMPGGTTGWVGGEVFDESFQLDKTLRTVQEMSETIHESISQLSISKGMLSHVGLQLSRGGTEPPLADQCLVSRGGQCGVIAPLDARQLDLLRTLHTALDEGVHMNSLLRTELEQLVTSLRAGGTQSPAASRLNELLLSGAGVKKPREITDWQTFTDIQKRIHIGRPFAPTTLSMPPPTLASHPTPLLHHPPLRATPPLFSPQFNTTIEEGRISDISELSRSTGHKHGGKNRSEDRTLSPKSGNNATQGSSQKHHDHQGSSQRYQDQQVSSQRHQDYPRSSQRHKDHQGSSQRHQEDHQGSSHKHPDHQRSSHKHQDRRSTDDRQMGRSLIKDVLVDDSKLSRMSSIELADLSQRIAQLRQSVISSEQHGKVNVSGERGATVRRRTHSQSGLVAVSQGGVSTHPRRSASPVGPSAKGAVSKRRHSSTGSLSTAVTSTGKGALRQHSTSPIAQLASSSEAISVRKLSRSPTIRSIRNDGHLQRPIDTSDVPTGRRVLNRRDIVVDTFSNNNQGSESLVSNLTYENDEHQPQAYQNNNHRSGSLVSNLEREGDHREYVNITSQETSALRDTDYRGLLLDHERFCDRLNDHERCEEQISRLKALNTVLCRQIEISSGGEINPWLILDLAREIERQKETITYLQGSLERTEDERGVKREARWDVMRESGNNRNESQGSEISSRVLNGVDDDLQRGSADMREGGNELQEGDDVDLKKGEGQVREGGGTDKLEVLRCQVGELTKELEMARVMLRHLTAQRVVPGGGSDVAQMSPINSGTPLAVTRTVNERAFFQLQAEVDQLREQLRRSLLDNSRLAACQVGGDPNLSLASDWSVLASHLSLDRTVGATPRQQNRFVDMVHCGDDAQSLRSQLAVTRYKCLLLRTRLEELASFLQHHLNIESSNPSGPSSSSCSSSAVGLNHSTAVQFTVAELTGQLNESRNLLADITLQSMDATYGASDSLMVELRCLEGDLRKSFVGRGEMDVTFSPSGPEDTDLQLKLTAVEAELDAVRLAAAESERKHADYVSALQRESGECIDQLRLVRATLEECQIRMDQLHEELRRAKLRISDLLEVQRHLEAVIREQELRLTREPLVKRMSGELSGEPLGVRGIGERRQSQRCSGDLGMSEIKRADAVEETETKGETEGGVVGQTETERHRQSDVTERDILVREREQLLRKIDQLAQEMTLLKDEARGKRQADALVKCLRDEVSQAQRNVDSLRDEMNRHEANVCRLTDELTKSNEELRMSAEENRRLVEGLSRAREQLSSSTAKIVKLSDDVNRLEHELIDKNQEQRGLLVELERTLEKLKAENMHVQELLANLEVVEGQIHVEVEARKSVENMLEKVREEQSMEISRLGMELEKCQWEREEERRSLEGELERLRVEVREGGDGRASLGAEERELKKLLKENQAHAKHLQEQLHSTGEEVKERKIYIDNLISENKRLKTALRENRSSSRHAISQNCATKNTLIGQKARQVSGDSEPARDEEEEARGREVGIRRGDEEYDGGAGGGIQGVMGVDRNETEALSTALRLSHAQIKRLEGVVRQLRERLDKTAELNKTLRLELSLSSHLVPNPIYPHPLVTPLISPEIDVQQRVGDDLADDENKENNLGSALATFSHLNISASLPEVQTSGRIFTDSGINKRCFSEFDSKDLRELFVEVHRRRNQLEQIIEDNWKAEELNVAEGEEAGLKVLSTAWTDTRKVENASETQYACALWTHYAELQQCVLDSQAQLSTLDNCLEVIESRTQQAVLDNAMSIGCLREEVSREPSAASKKKSSSVEQEMRESVQCVREIIKTELHTLSLFWSSTDPAAGEGCGRTLLELQKRYASLQQRYNRAKVAMRGAHERLEANNRRKEEYLRERSKNNRQEEAAIIEQQTMTYSLLEYRDALKTRYSRSDVSRNTEIC